MATPAEIDAALQAAQTAQGQSAYNPGPPGPLMDESGNDVYPRNPNLPDMSKVGRSGPDTADLIPDQPAAPVETEPGHEPIGAVENTRPTPAQRYGAPGAPPVQGPFTPGLQPTMQAAGDQTAKAMAWDQAQKKQAAIDQFGAQMEHATAVSRAAGIEADLIGKANTDYQAARARNEQIAAQETAQMMNRVDAAFKKQPDPSAYFHDSPFRTATWLMAVLGRAISNSDHPERANDMLNLLKDQVAENVRLQQEGIKNEQEGAKIGLEQVQKTQAMRSADLREDHEMTIASYRALAKVAYAQADAPGPLAFKAAMSQVGATLSGEAVKWSQDYGKQTFEALDHEANRHKDLQVAMIQRDTHITTEKMKEEFEAPVMTPGGQPTMGIKGNPLAGGGFASKALIAPITEQGKATAEREAKKVVIPAGPSAQGGAGVGVQLPKKPGQAQADTVALQYDPKQHEEATKILQAAAEAHQMQGRILKDLESYGGVKDIAQLPPQMRSDIARYTIALANAQQGHRLSDKDIEFTQSEQFGVDWTRTGQILMKLTNHTGDITDVVKTAAKNLKPETEQALTTIADARDLRGGKIVWNPPNREGENAPVYSSQQLRAQAGAPVKQYPEPPDVHFYQAQKAGGQLPALSAPADEAVKVAQQMFGGTDASAPVYHSPAFIKETAKGLLDKLNKGEIVGSTDTVEPGHVREATKQRMQYEADIALNAANDRMDKLRQIAVMRKFDEQTDYDEVQKASTRVGLTLEPDEIFNVIRETKAKLEKAREAR